MASSKLHKIPQHFRDEAAVLLTLFREADSDNDGFLTIDELRIALEKDNRGGMCEDLFSVLDADKDGKVSQDEYLSGLMNGCYAKQELKALFRKLDKNGDGKIDKNELQAAFEECGKKGYDVSFFEAKIREFDKNDDSHLDFNEFLNFTKGK